MHPCRVVKVGGSLLAWPALGKQLGTWLAAQPPLPNLLVAGGGELADAVRHLDRRCALPPTTAHWMAIRAMEVNALVLSQWLPAAEMFVPHRTCDWQTPPGSRGCWLLLAEHFLRHEEPLLEGTPLPRGWHVTSDSIAARVAEVCQALELVLLKSTLPEQRGAGGSLQDLAQAGLVDPHLPTAAAALPAVRLVNLRAPGFPEILFRGQG